jgi:hypothetical protein
VVRLEVSILRVVASYPTQWTSTYILVGVKVAEQATESTGSGGHHWHMEEQSHIC